MKRRCNFGKVDYGSPNWADQQRELSKQRKLGRSESVSTYQKKRKRLLTAAEEPIKFSPDPKPPRREPIKFSSSHPSYKPLSESEGPQAYRRHRFKDMNAVARMHRSQNGLCANPGCAIPIAPFGRSRAIDHCHKTGEIRGMLCKACNLGLGLFKDDPRRLVGILVYLKIINVDLLPKKQENYPHSY